MLATARTSSALSLGPAIATPSIGVLRLRSPRRRYHVTLVSVGALFAFRQFRPLTPLERRSTYPRRIRRKPELFEEPRHTEQH